MKRAFIYLFACACVIAAGNYLFNPSNAQQRQQDSFETENPRGTTTAPAANLTAKFNDLIEKANARQSVRIIVGLRTGFQPEGKLNAPQTDEQRTNIKQAQTNLLGKLARFQIEGIKQFEFIPFMAMQVDAAALTEMSRFSEITSIQEDELMFATLEHSTAIIKAPNAWNAGFSGANRTVAVMDTGVDKTHPFFGNRVVSEACYSTTDANEGTVSLCPGSVAATTAPNSGMNCDMNIADACHHGTHVAGIVGGRADNIGRYGVARDAKLISIQVFTKIMGAANCAGAQTCVGSYPSDQIKGLERVYALRNQYTIDSVNVSIGGGQYFANCDTEQSAYKAAVDTLRSVNIATIIAAGNAGYTSSLAAPACISTAISVGSSTDGDGGTSVDGISSFSNSATFLTMLAPGELIDSSVPGGGYEGLQGTSMAAPHVAGSWAVIKQKNPTWTVDQVIEHILVTGKPITDTRNNITKKRIRVDRAADILPPPPTGLCANAIPIAYNQLVTAQMQNGGCAVDGKNRVRYSFFGVAGQEISIEMKSTAFDTVLYLDDAIFDTITENDDRITFVDTNSRINPFNNFVLPSTGMYYISAASYDPNSTGSYTLILNGTPQTQPATRALYDFDGDGKADVSVFRPSNGGWYLLQSNNGFTGMAFGLATDKLAPADYDGDGKTDIAVVRNGIWYLQRSQLGFTGIQFGDGSDIPVPADYDGDGKADLAVFRPSNGTWYIQRSQSGFTGMAFGQNGDKPVAADYDGDGKADVAVFRSGTWYLNRSTAGFTGLAFGDGNDKPVPADYDGDGKTDVAVFRPSNGTWYLNRSTAGFTGLAFGISTDIPAAADYDGDGKADVAVYRSGTWYLNRSTAGFTGIGFGAAEDKSVPSAFVR